MNLAQAYSLANSKSGFARPDAEIYDALNQGGFKVYAATQKEFRGFFLKIDESSLTLDPNNATQEYPLPADCGQIVHLAERPTASEDWHPMAPETLSDALSNLQDMVGWDSFYSYQYGGDSAFGYYGPYLDAADAQLTGAPVQIQKIRVSPKTTQSRFVQIAYTAKWLAITDASSKIMLPEEGTLAMVNYAAGYLCGGSDDVTRASYYEAQGDKHLNSYLYWARARQIQAPLTIDTYGPGQ